MRASTTPPTDFLKPRGYIGKRHEVLGSDILAHVRVLRGADDLLGAETANSLREVKATAWYPFELLVIVMDALDKSMGRFGLIRAGRTLFEMSHEARLKEVASSARDIVYGIDAMYHHANRGIGIGGWKVQSFDPGRAVLEKTTPHHCIMEEGLLAGALSAVGCPSNVSQSECLRKGAPLCKFVITSAFIDQRWGGK